jgi:hypothetical protein
MVYKLSPSSLNLMEECSRCFWLEKHGVWSRPSGAFPSLPSGMDKILKIHFDRFRDRGELPPELRDNPYCEGLRLFNDPKLMEVWRNNRKGIRWESETGDVLYGAVDNILTRGPKLIVLDYKTRGFALKKDTADHYQNQLDIYNFLLRKNGRETEDHALLLFYIPKRVADGGEVIFDTELVRRKVDVENAANLFGKAIKLLGEKCPEKSCDWCEKR